MSDPFTVLKERLKITNSDKNFPNGKIQVLKNIGTNKLPEGTRYKFIEKHRNRYAEYATPYQWNLVNLRTVVVIPSRNRLVTVDYSEIKPLYPYRGILKEHGKDQMELKYLNGALIKDDHKSYFIYTLWGPDLSVTTTKVKWKNAVSPEFELKQDLPETIFVCKECYKETCVCKMKCNMGDSVTSTPTTETKQQNNNTNGTTYQYKATAAGPTLFGAPSHSLELKQNTAIGISHMYDTITGDSSSVFGAPSHPLEGISIPICSVCNDMGVLKGQDVMVPCYTCNGSVGTHITNNTGNTSCSYCHGTGAIKTSITGISCYNCNKVVIETNKQPKHTIEKEVPKGEKAGNKYLRTIHNVYGTKELADIDVYSVLKAFNVTSNPIGHAIKKLLCSGIRGKGSAKNDLLESIPAIRRAIVELEQSPLEDK